MTIYKYNLTGRFAPQFQVVLRIGVIVGVLLMPTACGSSPAAPSTSSPVSTVAATTFQVSAQALDTVVKLNWPHVPKAAGYLIYRDGSQVPLNPKPITDPNYADIGLTNGRTYTYTITVVDKDGKVIQQSTAVQITPKAG